MSEPLRVYLVAWAVLTTLSSVALHARMHMELGPMPDEASAAWAHATLEAARRGLPPPAAPATAETFMARGPVFVSAYLRGEQRARYVGAPRFAQAIQAAAKAFASDPSLGFPASPKLAWRFRVGVTRGHVPLFDMIPGLRSLALVPLRDGLSASLDGRTEYVTPDEILALGLYDRAISPPIPDLTLGTDVDALCARLAEALGVSSGALRERGRVERVRVDAVQNPTTKNDVRVTRAVLQQAARDAAAFILRQQTPAGRYAYVYDAKAGRPNERAGYSYTRHAGATFFLAQAAADLGMNDARAGALRGLDNVRKQVLKTCGAPERLCMVEGGKVEVGGSALTALAAAELLRSGDEPGVRALLAGLTEFLRSQQRSDGELMHEYDRKRQQAVDVQYMYYSGEAAMALLSAYERTRNPKDLESARRLMTHLTGSAWTFFGSRYFYGEEHWTCQAVGKAAAYMDVTTALDFCVRWVKWQDKLQYRAGQTPWDAEGAFGVGPVILPRITTASSRVEATVPIYRVLRAHGSPPGELRPVVERALRLLLRNRWAPGPDFLFRSPVAAYGGMPGTAAELSSRVDMVQHAGSAMLAWARDGDFDGP